MFQACKKPLKRVSQLLVGVVHNIKHWQDKPQSQKMGYSHYLTFKDVSHDEAKRGLDALEADMKKVAKTGGYFFPVRFVRNSPTVARILPVDAEANSEGLTISPTSTEMSFCKTNRHYEIDQVICVALMCVKCIFLGKADVSSDGEYKDGADGSMGDEWRRARAFYKAVFGADPPSYVIDEEEFAAPKGRVLAASRHRSLSPKSRTTRKRPRTSAK